MSLHGNLYKLARLANNADAILHPKRIPNRSRTSSSAAAASGGGRSSCTIPHTFASTLDTSL